MKFFLIYKLYSLRPQLMLTAMFSNREVSTLIWDGGSINQGEIDSFNKIYITALFWSEFFLSRISWSDLGDKMWTCQNGFFFHYENVDIYIGHN